MWQAYKYVYYWLYTWQKKLWGEGDVPEFNAVAGMSLSFGCNVLSIIVILDIIFKVTLFPEGIPKKEGIVPIVIIILTHYFAFMHKGKYREIEKEFENESRKERRKKGFFVLVYTFGSLAFFVFLLFFGIWLKY